jgi:betaine-aldehyde dehydrogenase
VRLSVNYEGECHEPEATEAELDAAVRAARQVLEAGTWSALTPGERAGHLFRFAEAVTERADTLTVTLANEMGAPVGTAREVQGTAGLTQFFAAHAEKVQFEETRSGAFRPSVIDRLPVGVVAAVVPWNSPLFLLMQKVAPALLAGCPVIIKPAPETSYSAYAVAEALEAAALPAGLVSVLPAGRERSEYLVSHPGIDKISFTGSTATGRRLGEIAARQFKRIGLELGGKSAGIVLPDADFGESMAAIVNGTTINSGQACSLLSRVLVPRARRDEFIEAFPPCSISWSSATPSTRPPPSAPSSPGASSPWSAGCGPAPSPSTPRSTSTSTSTSTHRTADSSPQAPNADSAASRASSASPKRAPSACELTRP